MKISTLKPELGQYPYLQAIGIYSDATAARQAYQQQKAQADVFALTLVDEKSNVLEGVLLYKKQHHQAVIINALISRRLQDIKAMQYWLMVFSQHRFDAVQVRLVIDNADLLQRLELNQVANQVYVREFTYPTALVLGGGGAHGAFATGVFDVLKEHQILPDYLWGVSVGAITGMSLMHLDSTVAHATWDSLTTDKVYGIATVGATRYELSKVLAEHFVRQNYFEKDKLREILRPVVAQELALPHKIPFTLVATEFPLLKETHYAVNEETRVEELVEWIVASSAFYPIVDPVWIKGKQYIDGGFTDNIPIEYAAKQGAKEIWAVYMMEGSVYKDKVPAYVQVHMVRSPWTLGPLLDFLPERSAEHMRLGEIRTRQMLGDYAGYYYAFEPNTDWQPFSQTFRKALAKHAATAPIALFLADPLVWLRFKQWLAVDTEYHDYDAQALGLAVIERLGRLLGVDKLPVYTAATFVTAIRELGKQQWQSLNVPNTGITRRLLLTNPEIILWGVLYTLSK
ncbi:patatin-like phospholipase family protein [Weissella soli]|uniref:patatin-like phospholipase family protein n=1 Tax=Weissella soli TaxID=155866 RepID=UPI00359F6428